MSREYYTRVTLSQAEYNRLRGQANTASSLSKQVQAQQTLNNHLQQQNNVYAQRINSLNSEIRHVEQTLASQNARNAELQSQLNRTILESNQRLQEQGERFRHQIEAQNRQLTAQIGQVQSSLTGQMNAQRQQLLAQMESNNQRIAASMEQQRVQLRAEMRDLSERMRKEMDGLQSQIDSVDRTLQDMQSSNDALCDMAETYAQTAQVLLEELSGDTFRTDRFVPGRRAALLTQLSNIRRDLAGNRTGIGATARFAARQLLADTMELRQQVIMAEQEWLYQQQQVVQTIRQVQAQLEASRQIRLEGETEDTDINYWTNNDLDRLQARLDALLAETENRELSGEDLEAIQAAAVQVSAEIEETTHLGAAAYRASCQRYDLIEDLERELFSSENGGVLLQLDDDSYQGEDSRAGFRAHLINPQTGLEMVVNQRPVIDENGQVSNELLYDVISNGTHNAAFASSITDNIVRILRRHGVECSEPRELRQGDSMCTEAATRFNVDHYRQEQAQLPEKPAAQTGSTARPSGSQRDATARR